MVKTGDQSGEVANNAIELATDFGDILLDKVWDAPLLDGVPLLGSAIKFARAGRSIADLVFLRKVQRFLLNMPNIPEHEWGKFYERMQSHPKERERRGGLP
jgi:hypothetical protein